MAGSSRRFPASRLCALRLLEATRRVPEGAASAGTAERHAAGPLSPRTAERSNPDVLTMPLCAAEPAATRLDFGVFQGRRSSLLRGEGGRDDYGI